MKKYVPHLIALATFLVITYAFFAPIFSGKELRQGDVNNWKGMSKEITDFKDKTGEWTYWTNSMFGGMPAYQIAAKYPGNFMEYIDDVVTLGLPHPADYLFLYMLGFYFLLVVLGVDKRVSIVGAIAFAFSSYYLIFIEAGHNSKAHAIGYMAPVIAGLILTYRGRLFLGAAITGLALALELYTNHLQITYYLGLISVLLVITFLVDAIKNKKLPYFIKSSILLGVVAGIAVLPNITNLMATQEYGKYSTRGPSELTSDKENKTTGLDRDYITDWSYGIDETFTFLVPEFKGGASEPISANHKDLVKNLDGQYKDAVGSWGSYVGEQAFTSGPVYVGAIIVFLFVLGLFVVEGQLKWWLAGSTLLSIFLGWGRNFMSFTNLFLDYVPGYDKFRAVTTILILAEFTIPLLAILAVDKLLKEEDFFAKYKKKIIASGAIVAALAAMIWMSPSTFTNLTNEKDERLVMQQVKGADNPKGIADAFIAELATAREKIISADAGRSLFFILIAFALVFTYAKYRYKKEILIYGLLVIIAIDMISVDRRYLSSDDFVKKSSNAIPFPETAADQFIKSDPAKSFRVLNLTADVFNDAGTSYYHQSIGGYHGAKLKRYKELIDYSLTPEMSAMISVLRNRDSLTEQVIYNQPVINMLNTKYFIINPEAPPLQNKGALGNAWFVGGVKWVANADSEIAALRNFDPKAVAIIDQRYKDALAGSALVNDLTSTITLDDYKPNHLTYTSQSAGDQLAVFSEIYYDKGWNAYIDGKLTPYVRANYVLRAMKIPSGNHKIEWKFEPEVIATGTKLSYAGSVLLFVFLGVSLFLEYRKTKEVKN